MGRGLKQAIIHSGELSVSGPDMSLVHELTSTNY